MNADEIARLRKLCEEATLGPWEPDVDGWEVYSTTCRISDDREVAACQLTKDAAFIAAARTALPTLLDERDIAVAALRAIFNEPVTDAATTCWKVAAHALDEIGARINGGR